MEAEDNKGLFERQWREVLEGASVPAPPVAWEKIEAKLATQKEGRYKKMILFYRVAAAAMTTIAVGLGTVILFNSPGAKMEQAKNADTEVSGTSATANQTEAVATIQSADNLLKAKDAMEGASPTASKAAKAESGVGVAGRAPLQGTGVRSLAAPSNASITPSDDSAVLSQMRDANEMFSPGPRKPLTDLESKLTKLSVEHLYGVARPVPGRRRESRDYPLVADAGIGAGSFDPNYGYRSGANGLLNFASSESANGSASLVVADQSSKNNEFGAATNVVNNSSRNYSESHGQGGSFSVGANIGKRIFNRLIVHSGVQYGRYNSNGTTNLVLSDTDNNKRYAINQASLRSSEVEEVYSSGNFSYEEEYNGTVNTYEFVSIPVKLGVILLDRRTGIVLNTGISSEFLLGNTVKANGLESAKTTAGDTSPYRNVYLNGTLGVEINYAITKQYKFVVEPYYRHAVTTLTKSADGFSSSPRLWGLQAGIRYELR